eukprot:scaffold3224_cov172-Pinguiococcus_pyrenoidosus.AAC.1
MAITQLGLPERLSPFTRDLAARFLPDINDAPSDVQQAALSTENVIWKVVICSARSERSPDSRESGSSDSREKFRANH